MLYEKTILIQSKYTISESNGWNDIGPKYKGRPEIMSDYINMTNSVLQIPISFIHYPNTETRNTKRTRHVRYFKISQLSLICRTKTTVITSFGQRNNVGLIRTFAGIICNQYIFTKNPINNSIKSGRLAVPLERNLNRYVNMHIIHLPFTNFRKKYFTACQLSLGMRLEHTHHSKTRENSIFDICHKTQSSIFPITPNDQIIGTPVWGKGKPLPSCRIAYPKKGSIENALIHELI
ncbi:hypothetical protein ACJIZ3_013866 [Penstemon smallii]|uniref:Uncharacterized protein n=1 Tax=Penstemon smallii TaxID=265156 RepID=A0ABD3RHX5_9LAMI